MFEIERQAILNEFRHRRNQIIGKSTGHSDRGYRVEDEFTSEDTKSLEQVSISFDGQPESISNGTQPEPKSDESKCQRAVEHVSTFDVDSSDFGQQTEQKVDNNSPKNSNFEQPRPSKYVEARKVFVFVKSRHSQSTKTVLLCRNQIEDRVDLETNRRLHRGSEFSSSIVIEQSNLPKAIRIECIRNRSWSHCRSRNPEAIKSSLCGSVLKIGASMSESETHHSIQLYTKNSRSIIDLDIGVPRRTKLRYSCRRKCNYTGNRLEAPKDWQYTKKFLNWIVSFRKVIGQHHINLSSSDFRYFYRRVMVKQINHFNCSVNGEECVKNTRISI